MVDLEDVGHAGMARTRSFMYIAHKEKCVYLHDLYQLMETVTTAIKKVAQTRPSDYMVSNDRVRALDNMAWCQSRGIQYDPAA